MAFNGSQVINGTYGELWCNGIQWANVKASQGKIDKNKETFNVAGRMMEVHKVISTTGKGSVTIFKIDNEIQKMELEALKEGKELKHKIISALTDPNSNYERVVFEGVSFDDITLADWEVAKLGEVELPFTFEDAYYL